MTAPQPPDAPAPEPAPRRRRDGAVIIGPTIPARYRPGALIGLPLVSVLLSPFAGAGLQQWRAARLRDGHDTLLEQLLAPAAMQLLVGALLLWALFALWAVVPLLMTHRVVLLDESAETLELRKGVRSADRARLADVDHAVGEPDRGSMALVGLRGRDRDGAQTLRQWVVPEVGWDAASFDGLRVLQAAAGLRPAPPRRELVAENRRRRIARSNHELADRLGMPWRPEYEYDEAAFRAEFDRIRRVLGGQEPPQDGDPEGW
ncbi:hypothetical protein BH708_18145 [Brachybacterium sp. P6-10-X1]|uniref:hypothetical protein n=1 Tax=Brachybacterium sp. P6-10-X1 TaxID=1903186 RepID=UPI0009718AFF|nr:hypothetical protein [Brachybacterium sp. P6-10-X1]APX34309.1 hypothetical protein BH708_18145 [Brachybacterium sp. P6-10-X1]